MQNKLLFIAFLLMAICNKIVADDQLTVGTVSMYPGDSKEVSVVLTNADTYVGFQFDLYLPEGITVESYSGSSRIPDGTKIEMAQQSDGGYRFIAAGLSGNAITGSDGAVMTVTLKAAESVAPNGYTAYLRNVKISKADGNGITVAEQPFTVTIAERPKVAPVTFAFKNQHLVMATETADATIHYTIDDTEFTVYDIAEGRGEKYEAPLSLTTDCTVLAIAQREGYSPSDVATHHFVIADVTVAAPTIDMEDNMVTIDCATDNVAIYYTLDGSEPTVESNLYEAPIPVSTNVTIRAIAYHADLLPSVVSSYTVGLFKVADVEFVRNGNEVILSTSTEGAAIFYTQDGSTPTKSSTLYAGPITMTRNCIIKAIGVADGYNNSEITEYEVDWFKVADVTFAQDGYMISMNTETADAVIHYTLSYGDNVEAQPVPFTNGDFESWSDGLPVGWQSALTVSSATLTQSTDAHSGSYSVSVAGHETSNKRLATQEMMLPVGSYNFSCYAKATTNDKAQVRPGFVPVVDGKAGSYKYGDYATINENFWSLVSYDFTLDEDATVCLVVMNPKKSDYSSGTDVLVDDATLLTYGKGSSVYSAPIAMTGDCTITAWATKEGFNQSETTTFEFDADPVTCGSPVLARSEGTNVITATIATEDAAIHYTIDGSEPTAESDVFPTDGLTVDHNLTIRAIALREKYYPSQVTQFDVDWFKVADVTFAFKSQHLEMGTETADATIYYTTDKTMPTVENLETACTKYEAPLSLTTDCMVLAIAVRDGYHPSDVTMHNFVVADVTVAKPTFSKEGNVVTIATVTKDATIYYTLDGSEPTTESTPYPEGGITMSSNVTIKAFAVHSDFFASSVSEYVYSDLTQAAPEFASNGNVLTISAEGAEHIYYALENGDYTEYMAPVTLTDNRTVSAYATRNGYNNSDVTTFTPDWFACADIKTRYDGRRLFLSSTEGATIYYTLDGTEPTMESVTYDGEIAVGGMMTVKAMAAKQYLNNSAVLTYDIPGYYEDDADGTVTVQTPGQLSSLFAWMDKTPERLTINGTLNMDDLRFLRAMNGLRYLNMANTNVTGGRLPDAAFANMDIVSIEIPVSITGTGSNLFVGCTRLAAIVWGASIAATEEAMSGLNNPNLLFYVNRKVYAPQSIGNVVTDGVAQNIELSDAETGGNFYCPRYFYAERISYVHNFTLESGKNKVAAGWESLALPFDVQKVEHEENGTLVPFTTYNNLSSEEKEEAKPFWLYTMDSEGSAFKPTERIVANTPYIICMPNNADYADNYNQRGNVTFSAQGINVAPTVLKPMEHGTVRFVPCFEHLAQSSAVSLLNLEAIGTDLPGSVFYPDQREARPFEAYITDVIRPNFVMRVFDNNDTGIDVFPMLKHSIVFENEKVYNLNGLRVKTPGKGLYIVNGKKVVIK